MVGSDNQSWAAPLCAYWSLGNGQDLTPISSLSPGPIYKQPAWAAGSGGAAEQALLSQGGQLPRGICPPPGEV